MTIAVSGGFDPIHPGHIQMIDHASAYGEVTVILNSDAWLVRKKGFSFQSWQDRKTILCALSNVAGVVPVDDSDGTVCSALSELRPDYFANGGDRTDKNTPELDLCRLLGIKPLFGTGGGKSASSSDIVTRARVQRMWGDYRLLLDDPRIKVKVLNIAPGFKSPAQRHALRDEFWFYPDGRVVHYPRGTWHVLENPGTETLSIIEVQSGECIESDIERDGSY